MFNKINKDKNNSKTVTKSDKDKNNSKTVTKSDKDKNNSKTVTKSDKDKNVTKVTTKGIVKNITDNSTEVNSIKVDKSKISKIRSFINIINVVILIPAVLLSIFIILFNINKDTNYYVFTGTIIIYFCSIFYLFTTFFTKSKLTIRDYFYIFIFTSCIIFSIVISFQKKQDKYKEKTFTKDGKKVREFKKTKELVDINIICSIIFSSLYFLLLFIIYITHR